MTSHTGSQLSLSPTFAQTEVCWYAVRAPELHIVDVLVVLRDGSTICWMVRRAGKLEFCDQLPRQRSVSRGRPSQRRWLSYAFVRRTVDLEVCAWPAAGRGSRRRCIRERRERRAGNNRSRHLRYLLTQRRRQKFIPQTRPTPRTSYNKNLHLPCS